MADAPKIGDDERVLTGVAGQWGRRVHVDRWSVRLSLVVLSFVGGIGIVAYLVMIGFVKRFARKDPSAESGALPLTSPDIGDHDLLVRRTVAYWCFVIAIIVILRQSGLWLGDDVMTPLVVLIIGAAVFGFGESNPLTSFVASGRPIMRGAVAAILIGASLAAVVNGRQSLRALPRAAAAMGLGLAGVALISAPFLARLIRQLGDERRSRIRTDERAEIAAQLHDSVLQTLALMQRNADDPRRLVLLARRQERELREWLYGRSDNESNGQLAQRCHALASAVEVDHGVPIDVVVVSDCDIDDQLETWLGALREAMVNAARHAGAPTISVYVEVEPTLVRGFVRDTGRGFRPDSVGENRRGIAESILARVERVGGAATLTTDVGAGTEWELTVLRSDQ